MLARIKPLIPFDETPQICVLNSDGQTVRTFYDEPTPEANSTVQYQHYGHHPAIPFRDTPFERALNASDPVVFTLDYWLAHFPTYWGTQIWLQTGIQEALCVALQHRGQTIGSLHLMSREVDGFKGVNLPLFNAFADQVAVAVANILANEEILAREQEKDVLLRITRAIAAVNDKVTLLRTIFDLVQPIFQFDDLGLAILEPDKKHITDWCSFVPGLSESAVNGVLYAQELARMDYPGTLLEYTIERVDALGHPLLIELTEELATQWPNAFYLPVEIELGLKECLFTNLKTGGKLLGSFNLNSKQAGHLANTDHALFQAIADQVAVAVANILANEEILNRDKEKSVLLSLSEDITSIRNRRELFDTIATKIQPILGYHDCSLHIVDEASQRLNMWYHNFQVTDRTASLIDALIEGQDLQGGVARAVLMDRLPFVLTRDAMVATAPAPGGRYVALTDIQEVLIGPLRTGHQVIGCFNISSLQANYFTQNHILLFKSVCEQVASALANILANEEILQRENEKDLQLALGKALNEQATWPNRLQQVAYLLQPAIPFGLLVVDMQRSADQTDSFGFYRTGADEYQLLLTDALRSFTGLTGEAYQQQLNSLLQSSTQPRIESGDALGQVDLQHPVRGALTRHFRWQARLVFPLLLSRYGRVVFSFYHHQPQAYGQPQLGYLGQLQATLTTIFDKLLAFDQIEQLSRQLQADNSYLAEEIQSQHNVAEMVGQSKPIRQVFERVRLVAPTDTTVLIGGETGTGKELIARALHSLSPRHIRPLIKVNCAALPANLIESELFGHERGAFTGAHERRIGKFELAHGGTLFLDEIGELPLELQAKLLRVVQEREIERLGSNKSIPVDVRILAATNRNLENEVADGRFRADLFYRVNVFPISLPPLRERREDLPLLLAHFIDKLSKKLGKNIQGMAPSTLTDALAYAWPGNIRELEFQVERAVILARQGLLSLDLPASPVTHSSKANWMAWPFKSLEAAERDHIIEALRQSKGQVRGRGGAAELLQINPSTLVSRMAKLDIKPKQYAD